MSPVIQTCLILQNNQNPLLRPRFILQIHTSSFKPGHSLVETIQILLILQSQLFPLLVHHLMLHSLLMQALRFENRLVYGLECTIRLWQMLCGKQGRAYLKMLWIHQLMGLHKKNLWRKLRSKAVLVLCISSRQIIYSESCTGIRGMRLGWGSCWRILMLLLEPLHSRYF